MKTAFESTTCSRCGGIGQYSWNAINGSTCFGCSGTGKALTKRGKAAHSYFMNLLKKPFSQVQPGDNMMAASGSMGLGPDRWFFVVSITTDTCRYNSEPAGSRRMVTLKRKGTSTSIGGFLPDTMVRSVRNEEERQAHLAAALAYQESLTKAGKPAAVAA